MKENNTLDFKLVNLVCLSGVCSEELTPTNDEGIIYFSLSLSRQLPTTKEDKKKISRIKIFCSLSAKDEALSNVKLHAPIFVRGYIFPVSYSGVDTVSVLARYVAPIYVETDFDDIKKCLMTFAPKQEEDKNAI